MSEATSLVSGWFATSGSHEEIKRNHRYDTRLKNLFSYMHF